MAPATNADTSFFGHPRVLATLFFTEVWERFSYYGMRALLILFMTASVDQGGLGFPVTKAGAVYGLYTAMVYLLSLPGGWMADRIMGQRRAVLYGGILISAGPFCLVAPSNAALTGVRPSRKCRSTFSTTTMASSTTRQTGSTIASGDRRSTVTTRIGMRKTAPLSEVGRAEKG